MPKIVKIIVVIVGLGIAFLGLLAGALYIFSPFIGGGEIDLLRAVAGASFIALGIGLGLPLAWQGFSSLRGWPSRLFRPRPAWLLVAVFVVAVILGQVVLAFDLLPALTFPLFYVLAAALPPLFFLVFVGRRLAESDVRWREVVLQLASGAFLSTFGAFSSEAVLGLLSVVVVFTLAALMPGGATWFQELSAHLQDPRWFQNPENAYGLLLSPPVLVALGLIVLVIVPLVEELFKSLGVVIMSYGRPFTSTRLSASDRAQGRPFDQAQDRPSKARSFFWGLAGGAGFALAEGLFSGALSLEDWGGTALLRVGATAIHCLGGGLMGLGWYYLFATRRPWRLLGAYATSASLHSIWNAAALGMIVVSSSVVASVTDEVGLALGSVAALTLTAFLSLLALLAIFLIIYLTRWLQTQMPSAKKQSE